MTIETADPVLQAVVQSAVSATGAARGWLVAADGATARVVAGTGEGVAAVVGTEFDATVGIAGFVVASGQPIALTPRGDDPRFAEGITALLGHRPVSVLAVPCANDDDVIGALELIDRSGGGGFTFDDIELATLLAGIAAAALTLDRGGAAVPEPQQLGGELARLAEADPGRYAVIATAVSALLSRA
jgi:GAF domain-containing protein